MYTLRDWSRTTIVVELAGRKATARVSSPAARQTATPASARSAASKPKRTIVVRRIALASSPASATGIPVRRSGRSIMSVPPRGDRLADVAGQRARQRRLGHWLRPCQLRRGPGQLAFAASPQLGREQLQRLSLGREVAPAARPLHCGDRSLERRRLPSVTAQARQI